MKDTEIRSIRPYHSGDEFKLTALIDESRSTNLTSAVKLGNKINSRIEQGGRAWIISLGDNPVGWATITPISGLPGTFDLDCYVASQFRRQGLGSYLLSNMVEELSDSSVRQLSYAVHSLKSSCAIFLKGQGFFIEHVEWSLVLRDLSELPVPNLPIPYAIRSLDQVSSVGLFRQLYNESFVSLPWYQPYESNEEVMSELNDLGNLLFLWRENEPIGFAWLRWKESLTAEIEPLGIKPDYRGIGLGRELLSSALHQLKQDGADTVQLGLWESNQAAIRLYQSLGFERQSKIFYLARNIKGEI